MAVPTVQSKGWILALFIRDDNERFLLGSGAYEFKEEQQHFAANNYSNDVVEVQGNDGAFLAGQVRRASVQSFDGYVGDVTVSKTDIEGYRRDFFKFFQKNHFYTVVYVMCDGSAIQRRRGYIVDAPEIKEIWQKFPEYHVALNFEDVNYYTYAENDEGEEIFSNYATVGTTTADVGGLVWDEYGITWDEYGAIWENGGGSDVTTVSNNSISNVNPTITITGLAENPQFTNLTTNQTIYYDGNITPTQTLVINVARKTALLNGTSVINKISGDWPTLAPGNNRLTYTTDNSTAPAAVIEWQEVVG